MDASILFPLLGGRALNARGTREPDGTGSRILLHSRWMISISRSTLRNNNTLIGVCLAGQSAGSHPWICPSLVRPSTTARKQHSDSMFTGRSMFPLDGIAGSCPPQTSGPRAWVIPHGRIRVRGQKRKPTYYAPPRYLMSKSKHPSPQKRNEPAEMPLSWTPHEHC